MKQGHDALSISYATGRGETVFKMNRLWFIGQHLSAPQLLTAGVVVAKDEIAVQALATRLAEVESNLRSFLARVSRDCGNENPVAPHDRRRPAQARHLSLPGDVFGSIPLDGRRGTLRRQPPCSRAA